MNPKVDTYLVEGCGRCPFYRTFDCKVHRWQQELKQLRRIVLDCGLTEELKWGMPCYTGLNKKGDPKNIVMVTAFKENCVLSFFKGSLLQDPLGLLKSPGENSQSVRMARFTNVEDILEMEDRLKAYIFEAIEIEKAGKEVEKKKISEFEIVEEFQQKLNENPYLKMAFEALTPGRRRAYLMHFSQPKQAKTRESRIDKCIPSIFEGKGLNDR